MRLRDRGTATSARTLGVGYTVTLPRSPLPPEVNATSEPIASLRGEYRPRDDNCSPRSVRILRLVPQRRALSFERGQPNLCSFPTSLQFKSIHNPSDRIGRILAVRNL